MTPTFHPCGDGYACERCPAPAAWEVRYPDPDPGVSACAFLCSECVEASNA
jgi:hypothetical protein